MKLAGGEERGVRAGGQRGWERVGNSPVSEVLAWTGMLC